MVRHRFWSLGRKVEIPPSLRSTIRDVRSQRLTYLSRRRLRTLARLCLENETLGRSGAILETGCALGGSAIVMCAAKSRTRPLRIYDVFGMIPPPSAKDGADVHRRFDTIRRGKSRGIGGDRYYGYLDNLVDKVKESFRSLGYPIEEHGVSLIQGLLQDTLHLDGEVALAHIDVDWYESVLTSLERIEPRLVPGGSLVIDDYSAWSGCRRAVDEYFADRLADYHRYRRAGALVLTRKDPSRPAEQR